MLPIPSSLLDKVKQAMQTIGNNAEPKMTIIAQKAAKFLTQGSFLNPRTVRTGNSLGPLDICIRREDYMQEPTEIVMVYIEDGLAKVATLPYVHTPDIYFTYQYTVGPATDVACDFDGRWNLITDRSDLYFDTTTIWALQTFGEPYIVTVNEGILSVRQGNGSATNLSTDTVKCSIIRGWKSTIYEFTNDQGLICAYTKNDGKVYYRNYCEQSNTSFIWEFEQEITNFTALGLVSEINLFRANDYRIGFLAEISGVIHMLLTERSWSGMAILPEMGFTVVGASVSINRLLINYSSYTSDNEAMFANINTNILQFSIHQPILRKAWNIPVEMYNEELEETYNDYGYAVIFEFNQMIINANLFPADFKLIDSGLSQWVGQTAVINGRFVTVTFNNFNNAENSIIAKAVSNNLSNGYALIDEISISFDAVGLIPYYVAPPIPVSIENIEDWSGSL